MFVNIYMEAQATYEQIKDWMNENIDDYIDPMTGELCCTEISEACADHYNDNDEEIVPEIYYDVAVDVEGSLLGNSYGF